MTIVARTVKGFCEAYGVGRSRAYELINEGKLTTVKAGTRTLITEESAQDWFNRLPRKRAARAPTHVFK
jgi:excisionase family DNA binding protein